jgi:Icc protein
MVLVTGDISEDASAASYARAADRLGRLAETLVALPGNHDDPAAMRAQFARGPWDGPLVVAAGSWWLVLLDSCVPGRVDGRIRETDIDWLHEWLPAHRDVPALIALHHHPIPAGSPWIDRYMLAEPGALVRVIEANECVRCVVFGHVHQAFEARCGAAQLHACPSTAVNSLPGTECFTTDPAGPAARWLELYADGSLCTGLLRAAAVSGAAAPATG